MDQLLEPTITVSSYVVNGPNISAYNFPLYISSIATSFLHHSYSLQLINQLQLLVEKSSIVLYVDAVVFFSLHSLEWSWYCSMNESLNFLKLDMIAGMSSSAGRIVVLRWNTPSF